MYFYVLLCDAGAGTPFCQIFSFSCYFLARTLEVRRVDAISPSFFLAIHFSSYQQWLFIPSAAVVTVSSSFTLQKWSLCMPSSRQDSPQTSEFPAPKGPPSMLKSSKNPNLLLLFSQEWWLFPMFLLVFGFSAFQRLSSQFPIWNCFYWTSPYGFWFLE